MQRLYYQPARCPRKPYEIQSNSLIIKYIYKNASRDLIVCDDDTLKTFNLHLDLSHQLPPHGMSAQVLESYRVIISVNLRVAQHPSKGT